MPPFLSATEVDLAAAPRRIVLPRPPERAPRHPFPLLASIAPVVGSLIIWAITSSPFALVFAALGPVIAIATMADSRIQARRALRRERKRFAADLLTTRTLIDEAHRAERARRSAITPGALRLLDAPIHDPERWRGSPEGALSVTVGMGSSPSQLRIDGPDPTGAVSGSADDELIAQLTTAASRLTAPIVVDARLGIGVVGPAVMTSAIVRGIVLQVAALLPPETTHCRCPPDCAEWLSPLPHDVEVDHAAAQITWSDANGSLVLASATTPEALPHACRVVIEAGGRGTWRVVSHPDPSLCVDLEPERVSRAQAGEVSGRLALIAADRGFEARRIPDSVDWSELRHEATIGVLGATFLVDGAGEVTIDLATQGPHAIVAGTTGSGKSELLVSWLLAIAATHSPEAVNFLLVDFKGGASFGPVAGLPHVVGLVTDLDERTARRALASLTAEVRVRERRLAAAAARSIDELSQSERMPRLLIVVDEFAALVSGFDDLHALFADLAARGRSLGVHLVLSTQRPAGVVRDSVLANVPLRISLRVNNRADSIALIGSDAASTLPVAPAGRAVVSVSPDEQLLVQVALAEPRDLQGVIARWARAAAPRRPWCDDLPDVVGLDELAAPEAGLPFGLLDLPHEQRQQTAVWNPPTDGNLIVLGTSGTGKTVALAALAHSGDVTMVSDRIEAAWDAVSAAVEEVRSGSRGDRLLMVDDLDALLPRFGDDHEVAFVDLLVELLRTGGASGLHLAVSARRVTAPLHPIVALCDSRLLLRQQNRQEHLVAGGDPTLFSTASPPGRGEWNCAAVQVATAPARVPSPQQPYSRFDSAAWETTVVVSARPAEFARRWGGLELGREDIEVRTPAAPRVIVGDVDGWHANWMRLTSLRPTSAMLFDGCTIADFRALSGNRRLPPPIERPATTGWLLEPGGALGRVGLEPLD